MLHSPLPAKSARWTVFGPPEEGDREPLPAAVDRRFRPLRVLGRGGMGCVVLCEDRVLRSRAAVKILLADDPDSRQRFLEEATLLANLRHPHLVQVLTVGETDDGAVYIAMEHLGRSLAERLENGEPLPWREAVEIACQIAGALAALHRAGVVHRDVKPENIVELRGVTGRTFVKLIDLGIARADDVDEIQAGGEPLPRRRPTEAGRPLGTPGYLPPEAGLVTPNPSFDVYALGATIYRLCTGLMPSPLSPLEMRAARPDLEIPSALEVLVTRAIAVLPEERPASAATFGRELAELLSEAANEGPKPELFDDCYEIIEVLGIGAKAEVHRAYHRDARRYVALKILRDEAADDPEERRRFDREARVLATLRHPAIPALVECRTSAPTRRSFIAMELRRGEPVGDLDPPPLAEVIEIGRQLAGALAAMHAVGIVHRDLNRTNVLVERFSDGRLPRASIVDFGQAELMGEFYAQTEERYPTRPELRASLGTGGLEGVDWTAPEARRGEGWTPASDVFSLGRLLFLLLTGKRPTQERPGVWRSPADLVPESRGSLADAILGALEDDPQRRLDATRVAEYLGYAAEEIGAAEEGETSRTSERAPVRTSTTPQPASSRDEPLSPTRWRVVTGGVVLAVGAALTGWLLGHNEDDSAGIRTAVRLARAAQTIPEVAVYRESPRPASATASSTADEPRAPVSVNENAEPPASEPEPRPREEQKTNRAKPKRAAPKRLTPAAFAGAVTSRRDDLARCARGLHGAPDVDALVRVAADGSVVDARLEPDVSFLAASCVSEVFESISFPASGASSTHSWPLHRAQSRESR